MAIYIFKSHRFLFTIIVIAICSCKDHRPVVLPVVNSSTLKKFSDATEILNSWSKENTVITHIISEPDNLHPSNGNSSPRSDIFVYTQRSLLYVDYSNQNIVPGLVNSMPEISSDGSKFTFSIRNDVKWDDGSLLTPDDIIFSIKAFKCPLTNDPSVRFYWNNIDNIIIDPTDAKRFTVVMKKKNVQNISVFTGFPILQRSFHDPENILASFTFDQLGDTAIHISSNMALQKWAKEFNDDKYGRDPKMLNGLGMYKVTEWETGQYITLIKKKDHWTKNSTDYHEIAFPEKIILKINKDEASQILEFKSQVVDVSTNLSAGGFIQLNSDEDFQKNYNGAMMPTFNYTYICFNERPDGQKHKNIFKDVNVRRAIAMLTPVDNVMKLLYKQFSIQSKRVISNVSPLKTEFNSELKAIPFDLSSAQRLLSASGWKDSNGDGILDKMVDGEKISLSAELNYLSTSQEWKDMANLIMEEMAKAGVQINPIAMDLKLFLEKAKAHDFDLMLGVWAGIGFQEDFTQLWHSSSWMKHGTNYSGFGNTESDELIDSIKHEMNDSARYQLSHRLQKMIYDDQPYVFLFSNLRRNVIHKRFGNQMLFSERPGILMNMLRLLSINNGITMTNGVSP